MIEGVKREDDAGVGHRLAALGKAHSSSKLRLVDCLVAICVHGCDELHGIVLRERVEDDARFELRMAHGAAAVG